MFLLIIYVLSMSILISSTINVEGDEIKKTNQYNENGRLIIPNDSVIRALPPNGGDFWNRLIFEKSPYLLQHAANPIDWYPWGKEAFDLAKELDKPIFLSIGYTTCHWCHVMEHESFENKEIAQLMNDAFVNIKVDREERPDVDHIYMQVTQMLTGRGGWPMTVIMTPNREPFFAGTYFPKKTIQNYGRIGMIDLVPKIKEIWTNNKDSLVSESKKITKKLKRLQKSMTSKNSDIVNNLFEKSFNQFSAKYDNVHGGFGGAPKFPKPHDYSFLTRYYLRTGNIRAIEMVEKSLYNMRHGGIYDHIGFGFHRYSVDKKWLVPHFEKMLYDQAMLMHAYLDAYIATEDSFYIDVVNEIAEYVIRDMTSDKGGFFSAEDADSEGEEGLFYIWSEKQLSTTLDSSEYSFIKDILSIRVNGNARVEGEKTNILHFNSDLFKQNMNEEKYSQDYDFIRRKIFKERKSRVHPQKDDKILTDWNGLMISALSRAAAITGNNQYKDVCIQSADFILNNLKQNESKLFKRYRNGDAAIDGMIEDYAFLIWGLIEMYQLTFDIKYLEEAIKLSDYQIENFWDNEDKGFYYYDKNSEDLIVRAKEVYDGAIPSGNSVSAFNFMRLGKILNNNSYTSIAKETIKAFSSRINLSGTSFSMMLHAIDYDFGPSNEVIVVGDIDDSKTKKILNQVYTSKNLSKVIVLINSKQKKKIINLIPFSKFYFNTEGPMAYICKNYTCDLPTNDLNKIKELLEN